MEFRQLEYFRMISKLENFTRAAEFLHVSQPSVTKAIKNLEAELKITLIDRTQKHVVLTPEGKAFLGHATKILHDVDEALKDMARFQTSEQGVVKLGMPPMIEAYLFPDIFTAFKEEYPNIEVDVVEYGYSAKVQSKIEENILDLGIILGETNLGKNKLLIMQDKLSLCVHNDHPLRHERVVNFSQLAKEKFVLQHRESMQYKEIYARCAEYGFVPDILLNTAQLKTIKHLVANGTGVSLLLNLVMKDETGFSVVPIEPPIPMNICLVWGQNKCLSQAGMTFVDFIKRYINSPKFKENIGK